MLLLVMETQIDYSKPEQGSLLTSEHRAQFQSQQSTKFLLYFLLSFLLVLVVGGSIYLGIQIGKGQQATLDQSIAESETPISPVITQGTPTQPTAIITPTLQEISLTPTPTADVTANWKVYNSPVVSTPFSKFSLKYPASWKVTERVDREEPQSLNFTLTNTNADTIEIIQGAGGGGVCVYFDDPDYTKYDGMGSDFSEYVLLSNPENWRVSKYLSANLNYRVICSYDSSMKRYMDGTKVGWFKINVKSADSLNEAIAIIKTLVY